MLFSYANRGLETHLIGICSVLGLILDFSLFRLTVSPVGHATLAGASRAILELPLVTLVPRFECRY
ncbi:hypothetical protein HDV63DRAFT_374076 [Trichoderma sp. SZMC 28014]